MHARDGVAAFLAEARPADEVALVAFNDSIEVLGGGFGADFKKMERALRQINSYRGFGRSPSAPAAPRQT